MRPVECFTPSYRPIGHRIATAEPYAFPTRCPVLFPEPEPVDIARSAICLRAICLRASYAMPGIDTPWALAMCCKMHASAMRYSTS
eukprot:1832785-Rhodomonas_salina.1